MMLRFHIKSFALIIMTLLHLSQAASCTVNTYQTALYAEINSQAGFGILFQPNPSLGVPNKLEIIFPAYFQLKWAPDKDCEKDGGGPGMFIGSPEKPICTVDTTDPAGSIKIIVTNLRPTLSFTYRISISGFTMGQAEKSNNINAAIGQTQDIRCNSYKVGDIGLEGASVGAGLFTQVAVNGCSGVTLSSNKEMNNVVATFKVGITLAQPIPIQGSIVMKMPKQNIDYINPTSLGPISPMSYIRSISLTTTGTVTTGGSQTALGAITTAVVTNNDKDKVSMSLSNTAIIPAGSVINLDITELMLPGTLKPQGGFEISTADRYGENGYVQKCTSVTLTNKFPSDEKVAPFPSSVENMGGKGVMESGNVYKFNIFTVGDIPSGGFFTLFIPTPFGIPSDPTTMAFVCLLNCKNLGTKSWAPTTRTLTFNSVYPTTNDYLYGNNQITFTLGPFTNPRSSEIQNFIWKSYARLSTDEFQIDQMNKLPITAEQGECKITNFFPTDNNNQIYALASSWTMTLSCKHAITNDMGLQLDFSQTQFRIKDTARCTVGKHNTSYTCQGSSLDKKITLMRFTNSEIPAETLFSFSVDSIINPSWTTMTDTIVVSVQGSGAGGSAIDIGKYQLPEDFFKRGYVKKFTVVPQSLKFGDFPVKYRFTIQPSGEVWKGSYFVITLPKELEISDERDIERKCDYDVEGFDWNSRRLNCQVQGREITIYGGFRFQNTTNMTNNNDALVPPVFQFTIPSFRNPRDMTPTGPFGLTIFDEYSKPEYTWNQKNWTYSYTNNGLPFSNTTGYFSGPIVQVSQPATTKSVLVKPGSERNGNITYYEFIVKTTNFLVEGDNILITLPDSIFFSENSTCIGRSTNIRVIQICKPSVDLSTMNITLQMPVPQFRNLYAISNKQLKPEEQFQLRINQVKNPISTQPTDTLKYYVYNKNGQLLEMLTTGIQVTMKYPGVLNPLTSSILPNDFRQSYAANYTLTFSPLNFQQNMKVILTLPPEILFGSQKVNCYGAAGTDAVVLNCKTNTIDKTITITDAFAYQIGNPGTVKFIFSTLKNPTVNAITGSFKLQTFTSTDYELDSITKGLVVNFFCIYPCMTCNLLRPDQCYSCYGQTSPFAYYFDYKCFDKCPDGYVNTTTYNCTACLKPCENCVGNPSNCTSCQKNFHLLQDGVCRELVYWPFPFFASGFVFFIVILAAEIKTKTESRFKEAFIALLALPEIASWATLVGFLYLRIGFDISTYLSGGALLLYIIINIVHAIIHPKYIVPNSLFSYKQLAVEHKCNSWTVYMISYIFSFKFSLILVSYFWLRPSYKGDYSAVNWMTFNKIALTFICVPYPLMMAACCYFLVTQGLFSYPGFICIEVIVLSSVMTVLMLLDAVSVLKCRVVGKERTNNQVKVASGLDYESDEDDQMKKVLKRRNQRDGEAFGADENSQENSQTGLIRYRTPGLNDSLSHGSQIDEETRKQIAMLEELARQMREEKEYLRLEKERIERERKRMLSDKDEQLKKMQNYMDDFGTNEPRHVTIVEPKKDRQNYKDIEGEMENYEIEEEEDKESEIVTEKGQLPLPVFGQINYIRQGDGDDHYYLDQLSPRVGQMQFSGEFGRTGGFTDEIHMNKTSTALYGEGNIRQTLGYQEEAFNRTNASYNQINMNRSQYQSEFFQQRQDAEMDQNSNRIPIDAAQQFFQNEQAVFSNEDVRSQPNYNEDFVNRVESQFGLIHETKSKEGSERQYFVPEDPAQGQATGRKADIDGQPERFMNRDQAEFSQLATPDDRQATPQRYFGAEKPSVGLVTERDKLGTPQRYFGAEKPSVGLVTERDKSQFNQTEQQFINREQAQKGTADDKTRHDQNSVEQFNQEDAYRDITSGRSRVRVGTAENQMIMEEAHFDQASDGMHKIGAQQKQFNATQAQFSRENQLRSRKDSQDQVAYMQASAEFGKTDGFRQSKLDDQSYLNKTGALYGNNQEMREREDNLQYFQPEPKDRQDLSGQKFQPEPKDRQDLLGKNFQPEPIRQDLSGNKHFQAEVKDRQDLSGKSESSEGIVDHNPFNSVKDRRLVAPTTKSPEKPVKKVEQVVQNKSDMPKAEVIPSKKKKTIIYSDKSESSVEEMMGDTPSNYNIPNGRLDGKSLGLKAIIFQAQKHGGSTIDYKGSTEMAALKGKQAMSPQATSNQMNMLNKPKNLTEAEERKFVSKLSKGGIDKSQDGGWGTINQPIGASSRVQVIGEEQSENEYTSGQGQTRRKKAIKTNKTFAEPGLPRPGAKNITPPPNQQNANNLANVRKNNFV